MTTISTKRKENEQPLPPCEQQPIAVSSSPFVPNMKKRRTDTKNTIDGTPHSPLKDHNSLQESSGGCRSNHVVHQTKFALNVRLLLIVRAEENFQRAWPRDAPSQLDPSHDALSM